MDLPWGFYLGWDWNPVVFFIILGLSLLLAVVMGKWQVLWVLPALVLYNGLEWVIPDLWVIPLMALFKLVFWVSLIVAVVTAVLPGRTLLARVPMYMMAALIVWDLILALFSGNLSWVAVIILAIIGLVMLFIAKFRVLGAALLVAALIATGVLFVDWVGDQGDDFSEDDAYDRCINLPGIQPEVPDGYWHSEADRCVRGEEPPVVVDCPNRLVQRPISDMERRRLIREGIDSATTERSWDKLGNALLHDASSLRQMSVYFNVPDVPPLEQLLTDNGECLSEEGVELHDDLMAVGKAMLGPRFGFAPLDGHNSWIDRHGHLVIGSKQILAGDRKALVFIDSEGRERYILVRCGNPVFSTHR